MYLQTGWRDVWHYDHEYIALRMHDVEINFFFFEETCWPDVWQNEHKCTTIWMYDTNIYIFFLIYIYFLNRLAGAMYDNMNIALFAMPLVSGAFRTPAENTCIFFFQKNNVYENIALCNTLQHPATYSRWQFLIFFVFLIFFCREHKNLLCTTSHNNLLQLTATHYNSLQVTATYCNPLQHTATHCHSLQLTATHCNSLQLTATHCTYMF